MFSVIRPDKTDRRKAASQGAAAVEMAIAAPILVAIVFGMIEVAHAFMVQHLIQDAARRGCRAAIVPGATNQSISQFVNGHLADVGVTQANSSILINQSPGDLARAEPRDEVTIQITIAAADVAIIPGFNHLFGNLTATSSLPLE